MVHSPKALAIIRVKLPLPTNKTLYRKFDWVHNIPGVIRPVHEPLRLGKRKMGKKWEFGDGKLRRNVYKKQMWPWYKVANGHGTFQKRSVFASQKFSWKTQMAILLQTPIPYVQEMFESANFWIGKLWPHSSC